MGNQNKDNKDKKTRIRQYNWKITTEEYEKLKDMSESLGITISELLRSVVFEKRTPYFRKERIEKICTYVKDLVSAVNRIELQLEEILAYRRSERVVDYELIQEVRKISEQLSFLLLLVVKLFEKEGRSAD